jgi:hypothetical protein
MMFIWFYRVRDCIIAVLIAAVSLLTSEGMSKFSLVLIVSVIKNCTCFIRPSQFINRAYFPRNGDGAFCIVLDTIFICRVQNTACTLSVITCTDCEELVVV